MQGSASSVDLGQPLGLLDQLGQRLVQAVVAGPAERQDEALAEGCDGGGGQTWSVVVVQLGERAGLVEDQLHERPLVFVVVVFVFVVVVAVLVDVRINV